MGLNRRKVVQLGTAAAMGTMVPRFAIGATQQNDAFEAQFAETLAGLKAAFAGLGFSEAQPLSIATGNSDYNGGLRHDFDQDQLPTNAFIIQPLARVADVDEKARPDVLPLFHEVGCHPGETVSGRDTTELMIQVLTQDFGLDPARIAFVSVPQANDMRAVLDDLNMPFAEKVLLRDEAEALAARDASGFFFPDPMGEDYLVTMGVYYRIGDTDEPAPASYPPSSNWTEIGEIIIGGKVAPLGISIGAERLTYAQTGQFPTWDQRLAALFALAAQEGSEPDGLATFR
ncbi:hypothetical protein RA28_11720 [Ruegeria sp. ANG-S4]|uniref:hypothetical protein n=1 Tax=Ruegeria sp. ANG-S4 TaxID=1577904 RepID=UPI00057EEA7D|nr:hypothetical protein [Ruegeria sp. ANG-S4]KIC45143.1 hypothetical protein RA28_11720 [Ruegeria sp. ANG-S4]